MDCRALGAQHNIMSFIELSPLDDAALNLCSRPYQAGKLGGIKRGACGVMGPT